MKTVADQFIETLVAAGVQRMYGIVGDSLNGLTDAIRRQGEIKWLHVRHEEAGAFAAGADAHLTGNLAVCAGSCGPGNLHLINGLFDCHRSRVPVLGIAAHIPSAEIGSGYFQETHPETLFKECSHYCDAGLKPRPNAARPGDRDPHGDRQAGRIGDCDPGRHRTATGRRSRSTYRSKPLATPASDCTAAGTSPKTCRPPECRPSRHAFWVAPDAQARTASCSPSARN